MGLVMFIFWVNVFNNPVEFGYYATITKARLLQSFVCCLFADVEVRLAAAGFVVLFWALAVMLIDTGLGSERVYYS